MDLSEVQREVLLRHGVRLAPDDPAMVVVTINEMMLTKALERIERVKAPIADEDLNRLSAAAARGASQHTMRLARSANRRTITVGLLGGLALLIAAYAIGSWIGWRSGFNEGNRLGLAANTTLATLPSEEAVVWARLVRDNPTVAEAMQSCRKNVATQNGRAMCSLPVWIEPLPPPNSVR
jgi:hypothetical protein